MAPTDEDLRLGKRAFGETLKSFRKRAGLAQETLARESGLERSYMALLEHGKRDTTLEMITRLVIPLEVSITEFFAEAERTLKRLRRTKRYPPS